MDSTSLTTASVAEISRLRADKALGEFIGGPEEAPSGQALNRHGPAPAGVNRRYHPSPSLIRASTSALKK